MNRLALKSRLVGTPIEHGVKWLRQFALRVRNPELRELSYEDAYLSQILTQTLRPHYNCVDVGAHLGAMLAEFTKLAPDGKHFAFEPSPTRAALLAAKFPNATVLPYAVGDRDGEMPYAEDASNPALSRLGDTGQTVRVVALDSVLPADYRVDLLKIDVEGFEIAVLRGARNLIRKHHPPIVFEVGANYATNPFGFSRGDLFEFMRENGYSISVFGDYLAGREPLTMEQFDACGFYPFRAFNYLAIRH